MKLYRLLLIAALFCIFANVAVAQDNEKKALTKEQILGKLPDGIINQVPKVTGWTDKNTVTLAEREVRDYKFFICSGTGAISLGEFSTGVLTPVLIL